MRLAVGVFLAALAVRAAYFLAFRHSPFASELLVDAQWHDAWARGWAEGHWSAGGKAFFRAPLYPLWLAGIYRVFGSDPWAARLAQGLLGALSASALAGAAARWGGTRAGIAAGAAAILTGTWIFFDGELLIPSLLLALMSGALGILSRAERPRAAAFAGALLGLAGIARPNALVLLPVAALYAGRRRAPGAPRRWGSAALLIGLGLVPAVAVTAVDVTVEGAFVPVSSQGGVNFYAGNHAGATGKSMEIPELRGLMGWQEFVGRSEEIARTAAGRPLDSAGVSAWWFRRGIDWIRGHPRAALRLYARKLAFLAAGHEIPDNRSLYFERPGILRLLLWEIPGLSFPWGLLFPLAAAGFWAARREPSLRAPSGFLAGCALLYALSLLPFFVTARYRMGLVPPLVLLAGLGLARPRRLLAPLPVAFGIAAFLVANLNLAGAGQENRAQDLAKLGDVLLRSGDAAGAVTALEKSRSLDQREPVTAYLLARAYQRAGRVEDAAVLYSRLTGAFPDLPALRLDLGRALLELGKVDAAIASLERAVALDPDNPAAWLRLETAYRAAGRNDDAARAHGKAVALDPAAGL